MFYFNVSSFINNLNNCVIADLVLYFWNYSFNIKSFSSLILSSFLWFLKANLWAGQHHPHNTHFSRSVSSLNSQLHLPPFPSNFYDYSCQSHFRFLSVAECSLQQLYKCISTKDSVQIPNIFYYVIKAADSALWMDLLKLQLTMI